MTGKMMLKFAALVFVGLLSVLGLSYTYVIGREAWRDWDFLRNFRVEAIKRANAQAPQARPALPPQRPAEEPAK